MEIGQKIVARVTDVKGECSWGHKTGDEFEVSCYNGSKICGFFYHDIFPNISVLQFGGAYPWGDKDVVEVECPDRYNAVKLELRRQA